MEDAAAPQDFFTALPKNARLVLEKMDMLSSNGVLQEAPEEENEVAAPLSHLLESVSLENVTHLATGQDTQLTQRPPQPALQRLRQPVAAESRRPRPTRKIVRAPRVSAQHEVTSAKVRIQHQVLSLRRTSGK